MPAAGAVARLVAAARRDALAARRRPFRRAVAQVRRAGGLLDTGATGENDRSTPSRRGRVRGATAMARTCVCSSSTSARLSAGRTGNTRASCSRVAWRRGRAARGRRVGRRRRRARVGDADGDDDEDSRHSDCEAVAPVRGAIDNRFADAKTRPDGPQRAPRLGEEEPGARERLWKETAAEYKRARTLVKSARHEVHKPEPRFERSSGSGVFTFVKCGTPEPHRLRSRAEATCIIDSAAKPR